MPDIGTSTGLKDVAIFCRGGLVSNENWLEINATNPGVADKLINFEPGLFGGYRRINGFTYLEDTDTGEVDPTGAEGPILGVFIYNQGFYAARKQQAGATYEFYKRSSGNPWVKQTLGFSLVSTSVSRVRYHTFNFSNTEQVVFTDGVNKAVLHDGTNWVRIDPAGTGADFANAGGEMALAAPKVCTMFKNHIFVAHCGANCQIVAHSAPKLPYDWTAASGAGQLDMGFDIVQIYPFRDSLYVFGKSHIRKIEVDEGLGTFVVKDVTNNMGCLATDSVMEVGGDLFFLGPDGVRPISGTDKIGDVELATISKNIQKDILDLTGLYTNDDIQGVVINAKSQFRLFFGNSSDTATAVKGILGGLKNYNGNFVWEFTETMGIHVACATSAYVDSGTISEYVLHGGYDGKVYRQEQGNSFNGSNIVAIYETPYIDFGFPGIRKTIQRLDTFVKPEGALTLYMQAYYDWGNTGVFNPSSYSDAAEGVSDSVYGTAIYGTSTYGGTSAEVLSTNIQGSGRSVKFRFATNSTETPYSIHGFVIKHTIEGHS